MAWFSNAAQFQELGNNLANLHVKYDIIKYKNQELEDRIAELDSRLSVLEIHKAVKRDDVLSDRFVESARNTVPITPSRYDESNIMTDANPMPTVVINPYSTNSDISSNHSVSTSPYDCDSSYSSDSSSCSSD